MIVETQLTRVEQIALDRLSTVLGLPTTEELEQQLNDFLEESTPLPTNGRHWTKAMRTKHSRRMKAYWRARKRSK